jgi:hypothetical protein
MYNPGLQPSGPYPELPAALANVPNASDALTASVNCGLCGMPIETLAELELVATTAVHGNCLRYLSLVGRQVQDGLAPEDVV